MSREFNTTEFEFSHGKKPRGLGTWAFIPAAGYWPAEIPADGIAWAWGTYTDAKREVTRKYPEVDVWKVLP